MAGDRAADRGWVLIDLGRGAEAERHFLTTLAGDPDNAEAHLGLAQAYALQERVDEARGSAQAALRLAPDEPRALFTLGAIELAAADLPAARRANDRLLEMAAGWSAAHDQRGCIELAAEHPGIALAAFEYALRLDPNGAGIHVNRALALSQLGRADEAETEVAEALRLDPADPRAHHVRTIVMVRRGGGRTAAQSSREALRMRPADEDYRATAALAEKTRNPIYRWLLRYSIWMSHREPGERIAMMVGVVIAARLFRPLLVLILLTWTIEPLMNAVLLAGRRTRPLVGRAERRSTLAFAVLATAAIAAFVVAYRESAGVGYLAGAGLCLWALQAGVMHDIDGRFGVWVRRAMPVAGALGCVSVALDMAGVHGLAVALAVVPVVTGLVASWVPAFR